MEGEREREKTQECNPQKKEKNKKPRTRRVSKSTLFLHHSLFPLSLSPELKVSKTERCGKTLHNSSPVKKTVQSDPKKEELKDYWLVMTGLASSPPRLASPRQHCIYVCIYCIYCILTTCNVRQTDRQTDSTSWGVKENSPEVECGQTVN